MDVLRICLKYGLDPNKPGTTSKTVNHQAKHESTLSPSRKKIRYLIECNYCLKKKNKPNGYNNNYSINLNTSGVTPSNLTIYNNPAFLFFLAASKQTVAESNEKFSEINQAASDTQAKSSIEAIDTTQSSSEPATTSPINYSSYAYLVRYPPLFLSISKCNHAATDLLLTYGVCTNIQDELGKTHILHYIFKI